MIEFQNFTNMQKLNMFKFLNSYLRDQIILGWPGRIGSPTEVRRFGADESIFGRNSDPIAEAKTKFFEKPIRFNSIKQCVNLIELK